MANEKNDSKDLSFKIDELNQKVNSLEEEIKKVNARLDKENKLVDLHKIQAKKYVDTIKNLELKKKCLRMDLFDLVAKEKGVDRDKLFEETMASAVKNMSKADSANNEVDGVNTPATSGDDKQKEPVKDVSKSDSYDSNKKNDSAQHGSVTIEEEDKNNTNDNITPLEKARAEFAKKNPNGFAAAERSKK